MTDLIERSLDLRASPQRVWQALTDPAELSRWFGQEAELELRVGGEGWFGWTEHGRFAARVEELDEPRRLAWRWARDPGVALDVGPSTLVEWTLEPGADGGTKLSLRESGFVRGEDRAENEDGWTEELAELKTHLGAVAGAGADRQPIH